MLVAPSLPPGKMRFFFAPFAGCVLAAILLETPLRLWGLRLPEPVFAFVPAFAWAVVRPSVAGPLMLLILGLFLDITSNGHMGLWPLALILAYGFVIVTRPIMSGQAPVMILGWYVASCLLGFSVAYLLTMLSALSTPNLIAVFWQFLVTVALYPLANMLIQRFDDADVRFR